MEFEEKYVIVTNHTVKSGILGKLCIVSILFSGGMTLFSLGGIFISGWMANYINLYIDGFYRLSGMVFLLFFLGTFLLFGSSLLGAILMARLKVFGFWMYIVSNGIMIILSCFVRMNVVNILFILISIIFIVLFAFHKKHLK